MIIHVLNKFQAMCSPTETKTPNLYFHSNWSHTQILRKFITDIHE